MKKGCLLLTIIAFIFAVQNVLAIGLSPNVVNVDYSPGERKEFSIYIINNYGGDIDAHLYKDGIYKDLIELPKEVIRIKGGDVHEIKIKVRFPDEGIEPGDQHATIGVIEELVDMKNKAVSGVIAKAGVEVKVKFRVSFPGKYARIVLQVPNVNVGDKLPVGLKLENLGSETINHAFGSVELLQDGKAAENIEFKLSNILPGRDSEYKTRVGTVFFKPGDYKAKAVVFYDSIKAEAETDFRIGRLYINLTNYSRDFQKGKVSPFDIHIENLWNNNIDDVYADIIISDEWGQVQYLKTPVISTKSWEKSILRTYWDTTYVERGEYNADVSIKYMNQSTDRNVKIYVYDRLTLNLTNILIVLIILIIIIDIIWIARRKRGKK